MGATPYFGNLALSAILVGTSVTFPTTLYLALFNTDPLIPNATEVSLGGYARHVVTFTHPLNGTCLNATDISFGVTTLDWGNVGYWGIYDDPLAGNLLVTGEFDEAADVPSQASVVISAGTLSIALE